MCVHRMGAATELDEDFSCVYNATCAKLFRLCMCMAIWNIRFIVWALYC